MIAAVVHGNHVLLVRRANPPDAGRWGFPGGKIEVGETIRQAAVRELVEETGITGQAHEVFAAVDAFDHDEAGLLRQHFVLVAVRCDWISGQLAAGDDALEARWFPLDEVNEAKVALSLDVANIAGQAFDIVAKGFDTSTN
ncbi:NUDIX hydrolase [Arthrobacter sp. SX1312]|uniref:NUDIX hydrolase n=1 Tax=Arthrobacter sp. SX1312 TaxID=2058896 RepID=UPI002157F294|nr:NUDIX hydrolase [Arthrobacter sp. SX1312]